MPGSGRGGDRACHLPRQRLGRRVSAAAAVQQPEDFSDAAKSRGLDRCRYVGPPNKQQLQGSGRQSQEGPGLEPTLGPKATRFLSLTTAAFTPLQGALEMIEEVPRLPNRWTISRDTLLELGFEGCTGVQQHKLKKENILLGPLCSPWRLAPPSRPGSPARSWGKGGKDPSHH